MVYADLHVHTTTSDGILTVPEVPAAAREAGVSVVAVTDHDRVNDDVGAPVERREGVTLVRGIELRVDAGDQRVDLLGYGVRETDALASEVERLQRDRVDRGRAIVDCVEDRLGVDLDCAPGSGFGRPDVARAVADHPDTEYDYGAVFDDLIGDDGPCYVAREVPTVERGRDLLREACPVVGLAHPLRYDDPQSALALTADLDAVERHYPYEGRVDQSAVDRAVDAHDLLVTGGSDAHERTLGVAGLDEDDYAPLAERLQ